MSKSGAWLGGSFAPPLDSSKIVYYRSLSEAADPQVKEVMNRLCDMVSVFQETPKSSIKGVKHPVGRGYITPLEEEEVKRIWDYVPWHSENEMYKSLFETIPVGDIRNAAFHLLWFAIELEKDREPITCDTI